MCVCVYVCMCECVCVCVCVNVCVRVCVCEGRGLPRGREGPVRLLEEVKVELCLSPCMWLIGIVGALGAGQGYCGQ